MADALMNALANKKQSWPGRIQDEPGLIDVSVPDAMTAYGAATGLAGALRGVGEMAPGMMADEAGAIFPKRIPNIPKPPRFTDLPDSERAYQSWEDLEKWHAQHQDWPRVLQDKWGMLKNWGGN